MFGLIKYTVSHFVKDNAAHQAAALAYYTLFSIAPLLIIAVVIVGVIYGEDAAQGHIVEQLSAILGDSAARTIERLVLQAAQPTSGLLASIISVLILVFGASRIFNHLHFALNSIWNVKMKEGLGIVHKVKFKAFSLLLVLFTGLILLASIILNTIVITIVRRFEPLLPGIPFLWQSVNFLFLFFITSVVFALIFRYIPSVKIQWNPVIVGAMFTGFLFSIGRLLLMIYLGTFFTTSTYGAAASLVVILLWLYYSSQILFLGAEFTQGYAKKRGTPIEPSKNTEYVVT